MTADEVEAAELLRRNRMVKVLITKATPEFEGNVWGLAEKAEVGVPYWLGEELVRSDFAKFRDEESLSPVSLSKIHWRETIPSSRQLPALEEGFYHKARNLLKQLKLEASSGRGREYEKAEGLYRDILNCRLRKIVALAASPAQTDTAHQNLSMEEKTLSNSLLVIIDSWRKAMLAIE